MHKEQITDKIKDFYLKSYELYREGDTAGVRALYLSTCAEFGHTMPVHELGVHHLKRIGDTFDRLIVVANHITTPSFFAIDEDDFISGLGLSRQNLAWEQIQPLIVRHYPLVNLLTAFGFDPSVVSGEDDTILSEFARGWGSILIPGDKQNRLKLLRDSIKYHKLERLAAVIFPEGQDSPDYLPENYYRLAEFKSGFAVLAHDFALPVVPISLTFNIATFEYTARVNQPVLPSVFSDIEEVRVTAMERVMEGISLNLQ